MDDASNAPVGHDVMNRYRQRYWDEAEVGAAIPRVTLDVPIGRIIHNIAATWDYYPGHHDPDYARSQGQRTIYIGTLFFQGFADRVVTDWGGPRSFITRRKISMRGSIFAGDSMYGEGTVIQRYVSDSGQHLVDADLVIGADDGPKCPVQVTVQLPIAGSSSDADTGGAEVK